jgi:hypothetical protein
VVIRSRGSRVARAHIRNLDHSTPQGGSRGIRDRAADGASSTRLRRQQTTGGKQDAYDEGYECSIDRDNGFANGSHLLGITHLCFPLRITPAVTKSDAES